MSDAIQSLKWHPAVTGDPIWYALASDDIGPVIYFAGEMHPGFFYASKMRFPGENRPLPTDPGCGLDDAKAACQADFESSGMELLK